VVLNIKQRRSGDEIFTMLRISGMTSGSLHDNGALEKGSCRNCHSTKLLIFALFVLYAVCQVQILVNREGSVNVANILREIQQTSQRIADMELSMIKVESTLDFLLAELGVKPIAHSRAKRQSGSSIRQEMRQLKRYLKYLERRIQCVMSDNGTDGRGKPCSGGTGGKTGYLKNRQKEDRTSSTSKPTEKPTKSRGSKQTGGTANSQISSQTSSRTTKRSRSTVYTYWGSSKCSTGEDEIVKTVYSGRVASLHSRSNPAVGSDYLCVPDRFEYTDNKNVTSGLHLSPVKYGPNMTIFTAIGPEQCKQWGEVCERLKKNDPRMFRVLDYHQVPCAVCRHEKYSATLVTPGRNMCHPGMWREYYGYLMTGQHGNSRSQHICVGADADGIPGSNSTRSRGPFLQHVAYKCDEPSCPQNLDSLNDKAKAVTCVVCSI